MLETQRADPPSCLTRSPQETHLAELYLAGNGGGPHGRRQGAARPLHHGRRGVIILRGLHAWQHSGTPPDVKRGSRRYQHRQRMVGLSSL